MNLQSEYRHMDVSHLVVDEIEHELLIRNILYKLDDHESVKRRKLKDRLKEERSLGANAVFFARSWRTAEEEIELVRSRIKVIKGIFESPKADARQKEKLRTRVIHYRVRIAHLARALDARKYLPQITKTENQIDQLIETHFPKPSKADGKIERKPIERKLTEALDEVRNEIATLNDTVATLEGEDEGEEENQAIGGAISIGQRKKEMELSMKRTDEILDKLNEYEQGKEEDFEQLINAFKEFVIQTSEQQRLNREKEIKLEEERKKEMETEIGRKQQLEILLAELNEKLKQAPSKLHSDLLEKETKVESETEETSSSDSAPEPCKEIKSKIESKPRKTKKDSKTRSTKDKEKQSSPETSCQDSEEIEVEKETKNACKQKNRKRKNVEIAKKRIRKVESSESSDTFSSPDSSESTESVNLSSESESSETSSDSSEVDRRRRRKTINKKKHRKTKKSEKPMKKIPVAEWRLKYDGK